MSVEFLYKCPVRVMSSSSFTLFISLPMSCDESCLFYNLAIQIQPVGQILNRIMECASQSEVLRNHQ
jgi:hypothetical protein